VILLGEKRKVIDETLVAGNADRWKEVTAEKDNGAVTS